MFRGTVAPDSRRMVSVVGLDGVGVVELERDEFSISRDDGRRATMIALNTAVHD